MLEVLTPEQVLALLDREFAPLDPAPESLGLDRALGRVLARDIVAEEYVPDFDRSTVDGYALRARDSFGCSEAIPAILPCRREVLMGQGADFALEPETCCAVPTGGALPRGADAVVMVEYTEDYGGGEIGLLKPCSPGQNMIFRGDDVYPGKPVLPRGRRLSPRDIGALAAIGRVQVPVLPRLTVGILSTGDELVPPEQQPGPGQIRDVNGPLLQALLEGHGARTRFYGIVGDQEALLRQKVEQALAQCDVVLLSGGSSVGVKDAACRILESLGQILLHGIAMKPGKPTILARAQGKPVFGLPGHPVAAYFIARLFVLPLLDRLSGCPRQDLPVPALLTESISANHGRAQYHCCRLERREGQLLAQPIRGKSGLITTLAGSDGFFAIGRDCEGLPAGAQVLVYTT